MPGPTNPRVTNPARVVDANRFAGQFSSQMPINPIESAPSSPRVGYGTVATVPSTTSNTGTVVESNTADQNIEAAATPSYGPSSAGAVTTSNSVNL